MIGGDIIKVCSICGENKPYSEYYSQTKTKKNGETYTYYPPYCKQCTINKSMENQKADMDRYRKNNREWVKRPENAPRVKARHKKFREEGKQLEWQRSNPDKVKGYNQYRNMHKKHKITNKEWEYCKNYFNYRCAYCGLKIEEHYISFRGKTILSDFHREHVDDNGANDLSNCIPSCKSCNTSKWQYSLDDWYSNKNKHFNEERLHKIIKWIEEDYKKYINNTK